MGYFSVDIVIVVYQRESIILPSTVSSQTSCLRLQLIDKHAPQVSHSKKHVCRPNLSKTVKGVIGSFFPNSYASFIAVAIRLQMHEIKTKQIKDICLFHSYPYFCKLNLDQKRLQQCLEYFIVNLGNACFCFKIKPQSPHSYFLSLFTSVKSDWLRYCITFKCYVSGSRTV